MPHLFDPLTMKGLTLRNRIGVSPMCMYSYQDGFSNDWQVIHLGSRAAGGAGLVMTEATAVEPRGRITAHDVGIWSDEQIEPLRRVTEAIKKNGAAAGIQLAHAGRKASFARPWEGGKPILPHQPEGWQCVGPSPIPHFEGSAIPHELDRNEIHMIQEAFVKAALRALEAGFNVLEIHGAHGYLIHNFLSPISNQRTDEYGGSYENRSRFLMEIVRKVRPIWPDELPLFVRLSCSDWTEGGWTVDDSARLATQLKEEGVDLIDCSSGGGVFYAKIESGPGYQVSFSEEVRKKSGILTAAVGLISSADLADAIIRNGRADIVLLGRAMLRDPYWAIHAAQTLNQTIPIPSQYLRSFEWK